MKRRQHALEAEKRSVVPLRAFAAAALLVGLATLFLTLSNQDLEAAIDPAERPRLTVPVPVVLPEPDKLRLPDIREVRTAQQQQPGGEPNAGAPANAPKAEPPASESTGIMGRIQDWLAGSNRDYQNVIIKNLSIPAEGGLGEDEIAKKLQEDKDRQKAADAARLAEQEAAKKRDAEQREQAAKAAEAKRLAEEEAQRKAAEAAQQQAAQPQPPAPPASPQAQDDKAKIAEELRRSELEQQERAKQAEAARAEKAKAEAQKQADEARRLEEERRKAEALIAEQRRQAEEAKRQEAKRREEEAARAAEAAREQAEQPPAVTQRRVQIIAEPLFGPRRTPPPQTERYEVEGRTGRDGVLFRSPGGIEDGEVAIPAKHRVQRLYAETEDGRRISGTAVKRWVRRATACSSAGRVIAVPGRYRVARGDSLWRISDKHYSSGRKWPRIYRANRAQISDPDLIYPCQRFRVP